MSQVITMATGEPAGGANRQARVLVVEDNRDLARGLRANLEVEGYSVRVADDGPTALVEAGRYDPDLIILDLALPGLDGFQVLQRLRATGIGVPVLILTARADEVDKVRGLRSGADDYVTKPFGVLELMARVDAMLRRAREAEPRPTIERFGDVAVDCDARVVRRANAEVMLTPKAYDLLRALIKRRGKVVPRQILMEQVWGYQADVMTRTVDAHIFELRQKLEEDPSNPRHIMTVWRVGYRLVD